MRCYTSLLLIALTSTKKSKLNKLHKEEHMIYIIHIYIIHLACKTDYHVFLALTQLTDGLLFTSLERCVVLVSLERIVLRVRNF